MTKTPEYEPRDRMGPFRGGWVSEDVEQVIAEDNPPDLLYVPIVVSLDPPDCTWATGVCIRLADHVHWNVRGNAILGFGHLARTCRELPRAEVQPLVEAALHDSHSYVRGHAEDAADDIRHFLGWDSLGRTSA